MDLHTAAYLPDWCKCPVTFATNREAKTVPLNFLAFAWFSVKLWDRRNSNTGNVNMISYCAAQWTIITMAWTLTFSVCFLHASILFLKVHLKVLQHLDLQCNGAPFIRQKAVIQSLHLRNKHLTRVHDKQEACRRRKRKEDGL